MRDGYDVQVLGPFSVVNRERKPIKENATSASVRDGVTVWRLTNPLNRYGKLS